MNIFLSILLCIPWPAVVMMSPMMIAAPGFATKKSNIQMAIVLFNYPAILFLLVYITRNSFYGINSFWWLVSTAVLGSFICIIYGLPRQLLNAIRGISNYDYFITDNRVYINGKLIKGVNVSTFTHFDNRGFYSKDKNHVYYNTKKIVSADAATFGPLANDMTRNYWHDKKNAYYKWKLIPGADGESFIHAGHDYAFDKNNVYFEDQLLKDADRKTFQILKAYIGRDLNNVFVRSMRATTIKDIKSFELIVVGEETFGKDNYQIYVLRYTLPHPLIPFPGADLDTFEVVGENYAKDKNKVYYYGYHAKDILILENAEPENFMLHFDHTRGTNATDGKYHYKAGILFAEQKTNLI